MNNGAKEKLATDAESARRPSWPYPTILFLYVVIFLLTPLAGATIGLILFFGLMAVCIWSAVSRDQFEKLKKNYPALPRSDYLANMLILPVIVPLMIFIALMVYKNFSS